jgi:hypothetical protein
VMPLGVAFVALPVLYVEGEPVVQGKLGVDVRQEMMAMGMILAGLVSQVVIATLLGVPT